jgi:hypothetical protein
MAVFKAHKVVSALPDPLEADALYYVRAGAGFDVYLTDTTGAIAYAQNVEDGLTWSDYATRWDDAPTLNAAITGGTVYNYTLDGVTRYRFVPTAYDAASDAFYTAFDGTTLSGLIVARGA